MRKAVQRERREDAEGHATVTPVVERNGKPGKNAPTNGGMAA